MATNVTMPDNMTMFPKGGGAVGGDFARAGGAAVGGIVNNAAVSGGARYGAAGGVSDTGSKMLKVAERGGTVEADGNAAEAAAQSASGVPLPQDLGANNERLADVAPQLVNALRELVEQYRMEGLQWQGGMKSGAYGETRLFWQGLQYALVEFERHELASAD